MPKRANGSDVWEHFTRDSKDKDKAQCKLCGKEFSYCGSTTTLKYHLQTVHSNLVSASTPSTPVTKKSTQPTLSTFGQRNFSEARQEKATALLTKFIVKNMLPLSLVDDPSFTEFINFLEPQYKVPCRQTFTDRLDGIHVELAKIVDAEMVSASAVSVTTDIWTSLTNEPYISFTASYVTSDWQLMSRSLANEAIEERHTQANIAARLKDLAERWHITGKIKAVVHDGASNMKDTATVNAWTDVSCSNHKLHLAVTGSMGIDKVSSNQISKCVSAASRLVGHFSHSPLACKEMEKRQTAMGIAGEDDKPLKLIQYVKTRWNSVYDMFERLVKLRYVKFAANRTF